MKDGPLLISTLSFEGTEVERVNRWSCMSISCRAAGLGKRLLWVAWLIARESRFFIFQMLGDYASL